MNELFLNNVQALQFRHPALAKYLSDNPEKYKEKYEFVPTPSGIQTLKLKDSDIIFHENKQNPFKSATQEVIRYEFGDRGVTYILGIGAGFTLMAVNQLMHQNHRIILFEKDLDIIAAACNICDLSKVFLNPRVDIRTELSPFYYISNEISRYTETFRDINIVKTPSYQLNVEFFDLFAKDIESSINQKRETYRAVIFFAPMKTNNYIHNLRYVPENSSFDKLYGKFNSVPAICVGAGPSLKKNIHLINEAKGKAVIIAVDAVAQVLEKNGIVPDIITTLDPQQATIRKFANYNEDKDKVYLAHILESHPTVLAKFPKRFLCLHPDSMNVWFRNYFHDLKIMPMPCTTVAHLSFNIAYVLGCDPIVLVGQDLSYPEDESHIKGVEITRDKSWIEVSANLYVDGVNGKPVRTTLGFKQMKDFYEEFISAKDIHVINATEGGADIKGTKISTFREVIDDYCTKVKVDVPELLKIGYEEQLGFISKKEINDKMKPVSDELFAMRKACKEALRLLDIIKKENTNIDSITISDKTKKVEEIQTLLVNEYVLARELLDHVLTSAYFYLDNVLAEYREFKSLNWFNMQSALLKEIDFALNTPIEKVGYLKKRLASPFKENDFKNMSLNDKKAFLSFLAKNDYVEEALEKLKTIDEQKDELEKEINKLDMTKEYFRKIEVNERNYSDLNVEMFGKIYTTVNENYLAIVKQMLLLERPEVSKQRIDIRVSQKPKDIDSLLGAGYVEAALGNYQASNNWLIKILEMRPQCALAFVQIAKNSIAMQNKDSAEKMLAAIIACDPDTEELQELQEKTNELPE